jgi:hypothetical protein
MEQSITMQRERRILGEMLRAHYRETCHSTVGDVAPICRTCGFDPREVE